MTPQDLIQINDLKLTLFVGVHPWEQVVAQTISMDIAFSLDTTQSAQTDDISLSVDYQQVVSHIEELLLGKKIKLLESIANISAQHILTNFHAITFVKITVTKPKALANTSSTGVTIVRTREKTA